MDNSANLPLLQRYWVKYGLLIGLIIVVVNVLIYTIAENLLFEQFMSYTQIGLMLIIGIFAAIDKKRNNGGFISYANALGTSFGAFMLGVLILTVYNVILYFLIDPDLLNSAVSFMVQKANEAGPRGNQTQEDFEKAVQMIQEHGKRFFLFGMAMSPFIFGFFGIIAFLISSAIIKKEPHI